MKSIKLLFAINITVIIIFLITVNIMAADFVYNNAQTANADLNIEENDNKSFEDSWAMFLINNENPLPRNYEIELKTVFTSFKDFELDVRCAGYAIEMIEAAEKDGIMLEVCSAYRSPQKQEENFLNYVEYLKSKGYSEHNAIIAAEAQIAYPNKSEHNAGLSLDIITKDWYMTHDDITDDFENTKEFEWLSKNSWKYGFILRYPKNSKDITGFDYEPWHYRFVGVDYAEQIYYTGLTLDEYIENYLL